MLCINCGNPMPDDSPICSQCGARYEQPGPQTPVFPPFPPKTPKSKQKIGWMITLVVLAVALLAGGIVYIGQSFGKIMVILQSYQDQMFPENPLNDEYMAAAKLMENQQYVEALAAFQALDGYLDSEVKVTECAYGAAMQYLDAGNLVGSQTYLKWMTDAQKASYNDRYYQVIQEKAETMLLESLKVHFRELVLNTSELPYDAELRSGYVEVYNNTVYQYTLLYRLTYYDASGKLICKSQELEQEMWGAHCTKVPLPLDRSFDWASYDVEYQVRITPGDIDQSPSCAVRLLDEEGNPIDNATVGFKVFDVKYCTSNRYGLARHYGTVRTKTFQLHVSINPGYTHERTTFEFPVDGWVQDVVVKRARPDFSVTVVDINGDPIPGVTMQLATSDIWSGSKYGKTDSNGYACWYFVDMTHTYKVTDIRLMGFETIEEIHFTEEEHHITVVLQRERSDADEPSFKATVIDSQGNPVAGVVLYITISDAYGGQYYARTDENGVACWYDLDLSHSYKIVRIAKEGYICPEEAYFTPGTYHVVITVEEEDTE